MSRSARKILISVVSVILVVLLIISVILPAFLAGAAVAPAATSVSNLQDKLSDLQKKRTELEKNLKNVQSEKKSALEEKALLDQQIEAVSQEIAAMDDLIAGLEAQIEQKNGEIAEMSVNIGGQYEVYKNRIRAIYEEGQISYLEVLLDSQDFSDFLIRVDVMSNIVASDQKLLEGLKQSKAELETIKQSIEEDRAEQETVRQEMERNKQKLDELCTESENQIKALEKDEEKLRKAEEESDKAEKELKAEIKKMLEELAKKNSVYVGGTFTWPCPGYYEITSPFGMRFHPTLKVNKLHTGTDIKAPRGAKIVAANSGTVVKATTNAAYGKYVMIDHGGGYVTLYAHMSEITIKNGAKVVKGDQIGKVGSTGYSTGNHLHFEIIVGGDWVNPMNYFKKAG